MPRYLLRAYIRTKFLTLKIAAKTLVEGSGIIITLPDWDDQTPPINDLEFNTADYRLPATAENQQTISNDSE